jgi:hypothetical protein
VLQVNRILGFALNSRKLRDRLMDTSQIISEVNLDYARALNRATFEALARPDGGGGGGGGPRGGSGTAGSGAAAVASTQLVQLSETFPAPPARVRPASLHCLSPHSLHACDALSGAMHFHTAVPLLLACSHYHCIVIAVANPLQASLLPRPTTHVLLRTPSTRSPHLPEVRWRCRATTTCSSSASLASARC